MKGKKLVAMLLASVMCLSLLAGCNGKKDPDTTPTPSAENTQPVVTEKKEYTYNTYGSTLATNWNPHTWEQNNEDAVLGYLSDAFLDMTIEDSENGIYQFVYSMATSVEDVTAANQGDLTKFGCKLPADKAPEEVTENYVYEIKLNPACKWQDGTPITADDYIYSMKACLDPTMMNYRSNNYWSSEYAVAGAYKYYNALTKDLYVQVAPDEVAGLDPAAAFIDVYDFWNCNDSYKDAAGNACPQYVAINDATVYSADGTATEAGDSATDSFSGAWLYEEYGEYVASGDLVIFQQVANEDYDENYADHYDDTVGVYKVDDYTIRYVYESGMDYNMTLYHFANTPWLVYEPLYEAGKDTTGKLVTTNYNSSVETSASYGPYMLESIQQDKQMVFVRNPNWWGWETDADGNLVSYTNFEVDGEKRQQYKTTRIVIDAMTNDAAKQAFLKGDLSEWTPTGEDLFTYATSDQLYQVDLTYTMRFFFDDNLDDLKEMDASKGNTNSVVLSNVNFRKAFSLAIDRAEFVTATAGYKPAYAMLNSLYFYDVFNDPSSSYRSSDEAMQAICNLYNVEYGAGTPYATLKDAYDSINGYNLTEAKELMKTACDELVAAGIYKAGDPIHIRIAWTQGALTSAHQNQGALMQKYMDAAVEGSGFGKVELELVGEVKTPYSQVPAGEFAIGYGAWGGAPFTPFSMFRVYCDPDYASLNEAASYDPKKETMTMTVNGQEYTMTWQEWSNSMGGTGVFANADAKTKLQVLAGIEENFLKLYHCFPLCTTTSCTMLAYKLSYYTENYNIMYGFGGMRLLDYNYDDAEWAEFISSGALSYE